MKLLPMSVPAKWEDAGPHISVVSAPPGGTPTRDANKKPDELGAAKQQAQCSIAGQTFQSSTEGIGIKYLLGTADDFKTNGPVMIVESFGQKGRAQVNDIRAKLGLGPFEEEHSVHATLAKVTAEDSHETLRTAVQRTWPLHSESGKMLPVLSLDEALQTMQSDD